ncbi:MAG: bifunctional serine/threonine-protein kinase/formylglycine-generating enzyme family protein, partial [Chthoniobacter sp.]|uniref:bifunctional serine/threonine-protein kinase/formylglycine-generating enzyme family protein n=1 Tax=Chthoniobacter sp. TaxID=2510640 RepID=UPI0032A47887
VSVDKDFADRFVREARAMARLNHPNIITVFDFGTTSEGHLYFVMEYVEGANLADVIHQTGLDGPQALSIVEQCCTALAYAHGKGIVHRDIKPANVMIDTESQVKVADFGLARLIDPGAEPMGHTMTGTVMGTPDYMAPEQMKGMNVDHRADIYSLGVMVYEMLCREVPRGIFHPPSQRTGCDERIDNIVIRAMQQAPEHRYQSTQEMKADVVDARVPVTQESVGRVSSRVGGAPLAGEDTGPTPRKPAPLPPPKKPATPMAPGQRKAPASNPLGFGQATEIDSRPPSPAKPAVMKAIPPPAPQKSKLPLYGGLAAGLIALGVVATALVLKLAGTRPSVPLASPSPFASSDPHERSPQDASSSWKPLFADTEWGKYVLGEREFQDGLLHLHASAGALVGFVKPQLAADGAIRARLHIREGAGEAGLVVRDSPTSGHYKLVLGKDLRNVSLFFFDKPSGKSERLGVAYSLPEALHPGATLDLELRVKGDQFTGVVNGVVAMEARDHRPPVVGRWGFKAQEGWYEPPEVLWTPVSGDGSARAFPSEAPEPGAIRLWDSPEKVPKDMEGVGWKDNALFLSGQNQTAREGTRVLSHRDVLIRFSLRMNRDARAASLVIRDSGTALNPKEYRLSISPAEKRIEFLDGTVSPWKTLKRWAWPQSYAEDEWMRVELRAVGNEFSISINGKPLESFRDAALLSPGMTRLGGRENCYFRDIVYVPLDKSDAGAAVPEPWQDIIVDPIRFSLIEGAEIVNGTLKLPFNATASVKGDVTDGAIRMVTTFDSQNHGQELWARAQDRQGYSVAVTSNSHLVLKRRSGDVTTTLFDYLPPTPLSPASDYEMEMRAAGSTITVKLNGKVAIEVNDDTSPKGRFSVRNYMTDAVILKSLQFLPLGGGKAQSSTGEVASLGGATKEKPFVNTLGQEFVPVPGTPALFCRWETRVRDYAAFAQARTVNANWKGAALNGVSVSRESQDPVCSVDWDDAQAFCQWLTEKERAEGKLPKGMSYRLPTDEEWSRAVGLGKEEGATPKERNGKNQTALPWGTSFPPPKAKVGNYADETRNAKFPNSKYIEGYTDGFATTSPVGSFAPNEFGIYDLGGNVWEWCEDFFEPGSPERVLRGASWNDSERYNLLSDYHHRSDPENRAFNVGFRVVLAPATAPPHSASGK